MKFGQPLLTTELSGSIGGATASKSRGGVGYFRVRRVPSNPRTFLQSLVRATAASIAAAWRATLTGTQRAGWEALAGPKESGINVFTAANMQRLINGSAEPRVDAFPPTRSLSAPLVASIIADASAHTLTPNVPPGEVDNIRTNVYVTAPQSASRASRQFEYALAGYMEGDDTAFTLDATDRAYPMVAGDVVYVKLVQYGQSGGDFAGQIAQPLEFRCVVVA